jgi:hypothetical protein
MSSAVSLRAAIHGALMADAPLTSLLGGAKIYDELPRDAALPYVRLTQWLVDNDSPSHAIGRALLASEEP